jgi:hypothetical protein
MTVMFFFSFGKDRDAQDGYFTSSRVYSGTHGAVHFV